MWPSDPVSIIFIKVVLVGKVAARIPVELNRIYFLRSQINSRLKQIFLHWETIKHAMKLPSRFPLLLLLITFAASCQTKQDTFRVFFLGGQSNMEGFGFNKDLPPALNSNMKDVFIFDGNRVADGANDGGTGKWEPLRPGHGTGFTTDGKTNTPSDRFGPELTFAARLRELYPNDKIAIIKYARNGSSIDSLAAGDAGCWMPDFNATTNQFDFFLQTINNAFSSGDINADGKPDDLVPAGILWMQGEGDASFTLEIANNYDQNLHYLMNMVRAALRVDDLPVVIGKISDSRNNPEKKMWKFGEIVQQAQEKFAKADGHAAIVRSTASYAYSDPYHYDSAGYIDLGKEFANAYQSIINKK
ncbi:MAG: hypothetical protein EOO68_21600 [Moraxellaceae bacterium]|nr:MAG: hypothetical protein EOO68_21600 [Moraxellaceae bacterium]